MFHTLLDKLSRLTALAALSLMTTHTWAAAPMVKTSAPGYYRFMLGAFEVTPLSDGTVDLPWDQLLKEAPEKTNAALARDFLKSPLETSVNAFLINTGKRLVLVDTGAGGLFGSTLGKLAANLKASGYKPEDVDDVLLTHMHPDHVGGLVVNGIIQFPNAVVHAAKPEADYWLSQENLDRAPKDAQGFFRGAMTSVNPYVKAGKVQLFDGSAELVPGIRSYPSAGHTVGHTSFLVESEGQKLLLVGDLIHVTAVQLEHPDVAIAYDTDGKAATLSRVKAFNDAAQAHMLVGAAHISFPGIGHLRQVGRAYQWLPANYSPMR